jgi:hypothetical protein
MKADTIFREIDNLEFNLRNKRAYLQDYLDGNLNEKYIKERKKKYADNKEFFDKYAKEGDNFGKIACLVTKLIGEEAENKK